MWVSVTVHLLLFIANIIYQQYSDKKLRKVITKDDFWFRSIVLPTIIDPLQKFVNKQSKYIRKLNRDNYSDEREEKRKYDEYLDKFVELDIKIMYDRCYLIKIHSHDLYEKLIKILEGLEDKIALYCYKKSNPGSMQVTEDSDIITSAVPSVFFEKQAGILSAIMNFHEKNKF